MRRIPRSSRAFRPEAAALEGRALLAAGVSAKLARGVLTITGTPDDDVVDVSVTQPAVRRPANRGTVVVDGVGRFALARVNRIVINAGDGDDQITVTQTSRRLIPTRIDAGAGDDIVTTDAEADQIFGGDGDDLIDSGGGNDVVDGGPGDDTINGVDDAPSDNPTLVLTTTPTTPSTPSSPATTPDPMTALEQAIVDLINQARVANGLRALSVSPAVTTAAQIQATNMARLDIMAHVLPGTSTPDLGDRADAAGYRFRLLGENIAYNYRSAADVVAGWLASPGHRANILNASYTQTGVAVRYNSHGEPYYAQVFGQPA